MRRDDPDVFTVKGNAPPELEAPASQVIEALRPLVTEARFRRITEVATNRTFRVTLLLEDITDPHNTSAILRSCDAFGIQRVHVVAGKFGFQAAKAISKGSHRWLDIVRHDDGVTAVSKLHEEGFEVLVASMEGTARPSDLNSLPKVAIVLGNEHRGPSPALREVADGTYAIPMKGFSDSLNVSVAAAITAFAATLGHDQGLEPGPRDELIARYLMHSVTDAAAAVAKHQSECQAPPGKTAEPSQS